MATDDMTGRAGSNLLERARVGRRPGMLGALPWTEATCISAASIVAIVLLWQVASTRWLPSVLFPTPLRTVEAWATMLMEGMLPYHVGVSLARIAIGFLLGTMIGVPLGLAMGLFRPVCVFFEPYVQFFRFVPPVAWIIPAILWFGIGERSKIFLIFYTTVFLVLLNTMAGVAAVARNQIRSARCFGARDWQLFLWVSLPATMPYIFTGMRIAMGNSFAAVVGAEFIAAQAGLGFLIIESGTWMATDRMFAGMLTLGLLGILADQVFRIVTTRWARRFLVPP
jgi:NitT/TauT family transport system permease protein